MRFHLILKNRKPIFADCFIFAAFTCLNIDIYFFVFSFPSTEDTISSKDEERTFKDQHQENEEKGISTSSTTGHKSIFGGPRKIG